MIRFVSNGLIQKKGAYVLHLTIVLDTSRYPFLSVLPKLTLLKNLESYLFFHPHITILRYLACPISDYNCLHQVGNPDYFFEITAVASCIFNQERSINPVIGTLQTSTDLINFALPISDAPRVDLTLGKSISPGSIYEGGDVYFDCLVIASPTPYKILWFQDVSS